MDRNRRYSDEEVARILVEATDAQAGGQSSLPASSSGTTLDELQSIGREVGIPADLIEQAATRLDRPLPAPVPAPRFLGAQVGVGRTLNLPRALTDAEWDHLVVDLRETFNARGKVGQHGRFREWTNGNLHALLEPTESGERLRLRTVKGSAMGYMRAGSALLAISAVVMVIAFLSGTNDWSNLFGPLFLALMGGGMFASGRIGLSSWASQRELQMEGVAARLAAAVEDTDEPV